jgi:membrane protease YdiL (CAAX protease family)
MLAFFALTYAVMWICFFTVAVAIPAATPFGQMLLFLGTFSPGLVALSFTAREEGITGVRNLLRHVIQWQVGWQWYAFAVTYIVLIKLTVALLHRAIIGAWPRFGTDPWYGIVIAIVLSTPFQAGEEIGWRGYALPRLTKRLGLATASVVLGLIWGFWHLPQFFIRAADTYHQSFVLFVLQVTAFSVALAWLWYRTNGSLLLPMLMHAATNNAKDVVPSATPGGTGVFGMHVSLVFFLTVAILWVCAVYLLIRMSRESGTSQTGSIETAPKTPVAGIS